MINTRSFMGKVGEYKQRLQFIQSKDHSRKRKQRKVRNTTFERRTKARLDGASSSGAAAPVTPAVLGPPPALPRR
ncbi:hypothetical protein LINPERPRIM_LOCUS40555, partial [Linum perenne]